jgi:hypothetical protein
MTFTKSKSDEKNWEGFEVYRRVSCKGDFDQCDGNTLHFLITNSSEIVYMNLDLLVALVCLCANKWKNCG